MFDLLNEISELVYVADLDSHELLYMNTAGRQSFAVGSVEGQKCYRVLQNREQPCENCPNGHLRLHEVFSWECDNPVSHRHYRLRNQRVEWEGKPANLTVAFDQTEDVRQRTALKSALEGQNTVVDCVKLLNGTGDLSKALDTLLEKVGRFLEAERAYLFEIRGEVMNNTHEWCAAGIKPQISMLQNLPVPLNDKSMGAFRGGACLALPSLDGLRDKHPAEYEELKEQGIERLMAWPLEQGGQLLGYLGVDNPAVEKLENTPSLLSTLAYFISSSLRRQDDQLLLETLSYYDPLTGALNRNAFIRDLEAFAPLPESVGVVCVDINGMKEINDEQGHPYGDHILVSMAETLTSLFGPGNLYRSGGDEFVVICRSLSETHLEARVQELRSLMDSNREYRASVGYRWAPECSGLQRILFEADEVMYADKKRFYHGMPGLRYRHNNDDILGLTKPGALERMIAEGRFLVYFQPKVSIFSGRQIGAEALVRLRTPQNAIVAPDQFIPILEDSRMIGQIDFYVFDRVCAYLHRWRAKGFSVVPVSVNFSRHTLIQSDFQEHLHDVWKQYGVPKEFLEIEVTESVETDDSYNFIRVIEQMRAAGFSVSIDDFGVRNANLSLFTSVDFDVLKIDRSLVTELPHNFKARAIIRSVSDICRQMNIRLIAEGVETQEQAQALQELDCTGVQGYLFSRPLPRKEYESQYLCNP